MTHAAPAADEPFVVRLRTKSQNFTSEGMTQVDAETRAATTERELAGIGDSPRFLTFIGRDRRVTMIRGRDIIAIDVCPESQDLPARRPLGGWPGAGGRVEPRGDSSTAGFISEDPPAPVPMPDGTAFLRRQTPGTGPRTPQGGRR